MYHYRYNEADNMTQLRTLTYHLLLEEPQTGYSLAKNIEERTGWKPSWGSIYPTLEKLEEQGHVKAKETGRSTTYTLTKKGITAAKKHQEDHSEAITKIIEQLHVLNEVSDDDLSHAIEALNHLKESGEDPYLPIKKHAQNMQEQLHTLWKNGKISTHAKHINHVLQEATKELRKL